MTHTGWAGAFAGALLFACTASAATRSSTFGVTATVAPACRVAAPVFAPTHRLVEIRCAPRMPYAVTVQRAPRASDDGGPQRFLVLVTY